MKDSPTPRTDALRTKLHENINTPNIVKYMETVLHANTLEMELTAVTKERDEARERADTMFAKHADILDQSRQERDEAREQRDRLETILKDCLYEMPVGYIPNHTVENLPLMIKSQARMLAEEITHSEKLEEQLQESREYADRLVEHKDMVCLPADLANLRAANTHFAAENETLKKEIKNLRDLLMFGK